MSRVGWAAAILGTAAVLCLQCVHGTCAGALWRDEVTSVNLATMPTFAEFSDNMQGDSSPALWFVILRPWCAAGLGSDTGLRVLGFMVAIGVLGVVWSAVRRLGAELPLLCLAMFAMNPEVIRRGASIRAYGLGGIFVLLTVVLMWEMIQSPTPRRVALAAAASVLSVQALYHNAVLLLTIGGCASAMAVRRRMWKKALLPIGVGVLAGISFLPYLPTIRKVSVWSALAGTNVTWADMAGAFRTAMGQGLEIMVWVWAGLVALALAAAVFCQVRRWTPDLTDRQRDTTLYCGLLVAVGTAVYAFFLKALSYGLNPWYFYVWMGFVAVCADCAVGTLGRGIIWPLVRVAWLTVVLAFALGPTLEAVRIRMTNIDSAAAILNKWARQGDLIIVNPWTHGVSFTRYYHGAAEWVTVPELADHRTHRYDQVLARMKTANPVADIEAKTETALKAGHRVWVLADISVPPRPFWRPPALPATDDPRTWKRVRLLVPDGRGGTVMREGQFYFAWWTGQIAMALARGGAVEEQVPVTEGIHIDDGAPVASELRRKDICPLEVFPMKVFAAGDLLHPVPDN